jgi:hypothetical protein
MTKAQSGLCHLISQATKNAITIHDSKNEIPKDNALGIL